MYDYRSCTSTVVWQRYQTTSKSLFHYKRESLLIGVILVKPDFLKATTKAMNAKTIGTRMAVFQIIPESNVNLRLHLKSKQRSGQMLIKTKKKYILRPFKHQCNRYTLQLILIIDYIITLRPSFKFNPLQKRYNLLLWEVIQPQREVYMRFSSS